MSTVLRRGAALAVLLTGSTSCRPSDEAAHAPAGVGAAAEVTPVRTDAHRGEGVRFAFHAEPELQPAFDTVFGALKRRRRAAPELSEATLHRFAVDSAEQRYVLLARLIPSERIPLGQWGWAFIAIEREGDAWHLSRAYDFKADEHLAFIASRDIDGDGRADAIYCAWYEGQDDLVSARALGYRDHRWYAIDFAARRNRDCRAEPEGSSR